MKHNIVYFIILAIIIFIAYVELKKYMINQIFAKGLLEDTVLNRQALANQNLIQVFQTSNSVKL